MSDIVRVLRVLEIVGPRRLVEQQLKRSIHGVSTFYNGEVEVRASTVGITADVLEMGKVEQVLPSPVVVPPWPGPGAEHPPESYPATGLLCSACRQPQFQTPAGDVCENGHGGVPGIISNLFGQ